MTTTTRLNLKVGDRVKTPCGHFGTIKQATPVLYAVRFDQDTPNAVAHANLFRPDGTQCRIHRSGGEAVRIDPVHPAMPAIGTEMRCIGYDTVRGKVIAHIPDGGVVVQSCRTASALYALDAQLVDTAGDRWVATPKPERVVVYRNIYADGTMGGTAHKSMDVALSCTKYGKTAAGLLKQVRVAGEIVEARVMARVPQLRTRSNPEGINPFA